jgi:hypothetical protein
VRPQNLPLRRARPGNRQRPLTWPNYTERLARAWGSRGRLARSARKMLVIVTFGIATYSYKNFTLQLLV